MKGKITGWGEFRTCPNAPGPNNCTIRCIKWIFLLTVMRILMCYFKWKLWKTRATWLFINQGLIHSRSSHSPPQWGHQKWGHKTRDESERAVGELPQGSCTLTNPRGSLTPWIKFGKGAPPCFFREQGNYTVLSFSLSLRFGVSHEVESSHYAST